MSETTDKARHRIRERLAWVRTSYTGEARRYAERPLLDALAMADYIEVMEWVFDTEVDFIDIHSDACDRLEKVKHKFEEAIGD